MQFLIERRLRRGNALVRTTSKYQSYWGRMAHAEILLYGGMWAQGDGDTLLLRVANPTGMRHVLAGDPYVMERIVIETTTRELGDSIPRPDAFACAHRSGTSRVECRPGDRSELSAHEQRLARMILDGLTNRQIADQLQVTQRAVEQHITRIYRKLDIGRRAQLAVALQGHSASV
ncbi:LuxR C-terminal-related transcriptional regulator [Streptomyces sp. NPDC058665]|uniref:helix-turn-helix transcriptional regulator n=1 Tax=Streptomyces sp. NPDC058665 TaxID=3346586 RepID=UPI0036488707